MELSGITRHFAVPSNVFLPAGRLVAAALCLALAACAPPGMPKTNAPVENLAYPSFGAPAQIGNRPVMTPEQQQKKQSELEDLGTNRASDMQGQINEGGDLKPGQ